MKQIRLAIVAVAALVGSCASTVHAQALNFGSYSYITLGDIVTDNQSYTKEAWIRLHGYYTTHGANIFSAWDHPFWLENGVLKAANNYGSTSTATVLDSVAIPLNVWTHVAVTYDAPSTTMKLYKNGVLIAVNTAAPSYIASVLQIGAQNFGDFFDNGDIDEVRLWNNARTQSQIQTYMNCDVPQQSGLIAYYRFDQGTPGADNTALVNSVYDYSGNANCGAMVNFNLTGTSSNFIAGAISSCSTIAVVTSAPASITGSSAVCAGSTITLSDSLSGGSWSSDDIDTASIAANGVVTGNYAGIVDISYKTCGGVVTKTITVNPTPTAALTAANGAISAAVSGGTSPYTYSWSNGSAVANLTGLAAGTYSVTVTDANGCIATATSYVAPAAVTLTNSIAISPCTNVYTGCNKHNMFLGYGASCYTLTANPTGASSFTYSWSPSTHLSSTTAKSVTFTPTAAGQYTFTCTATNNGHSVSATVTICVSDAVDHNHWGNVFVCHYSGWNHSTCHSISMIASAVDAYLKKNPFDCIGNSGSSCSGSFKSTTNNDQNGMIVVGNELEVNAFPNPFSDNVSIQANEVGSNEQLIAIVYDITGREISRAIGQLGNNELSVGQGLIPGVYIVEVHNGDMTKRIKIVKSN